ncbi:MAG: glycosyltransferase family 4 protein, partial [Nitrososphaerota archaeon]|nr:glycosyltransferase family 4 protein [Nitrososphaerota archaeon]
MLQDASQVRCFVRISIISPFAYPPYRGGIEYETYHLAREWISEGHEVNIITSKKLGGGAYNVMIDGIRYIRIPCAGSSRLTIPILLSRTVYRAIDNSDIIYVKGLMTAFSIILNTYAALRRKTYVVHIHNEAVSGGKLIRRLLIRTFDFLSRFIVERATLLQGETKLDIRYYESKVLDGNKFLILPPGLSNELFSTTNTRKFGRDAMHLDEKCTMILFLGRLDPLKGTEVAFEAFVDVVKRRNSNLMLVLAGSETMSTRHLSERIGKAGLSKQIQLFPNVTEYQKTWLYDAADIVVIPSLFDYVEAFSLTLSESWLRRRPVIASRVGALSFRIRHGVNGLLVSPGSVKELADAIERLLDDTNLRRAISEGPHEEIRSWSESAEVLASVFRKLVKRTNSR